MFRVSGVGCGVERVVYSACCLVSGVESCEFRVQGLGMRDLGVGETKRMKIQDSRFTYG